MDKVEPTGSARNQTILYVEDRARWRTTVARHLSEAGYCVLLFSKMSEAQEYYAEHESEITLALCDGSVNKTGDGRKWAAALHKAGKKSVVLSSEGAEGVPFVSKGYWSKELLPTLEQVIGG